MIVLLATITSTMARTTISTINRDKGICHFYGDPHVILFPQRSEAFQHQYWCKTRGEHLILQNDYVQITVTVQNRTWLVDEVSSSIAKHVSL
jgi:hypothetical protein